VYGFLGTTNYKIVPRKPKPAKEAAELLVKQSKILKDAERDKLRRESFKAKAVDVDKLPEGEAGWIKKPV